MDELLKSAGYKLEGKYPILKALVFSIEVDFSNSTAIIWYGTKQEEITKCKIQPELVYEEILKSYSDITERYYNEEEFLNDLFNAYKIAAYRIGRKIVDQIPIMKVLLDYLYFIQNANFKANPKKSNFTEYSRIYFSYDLFRLSTHRFKNYELILREASRAYTQKHQDFLWIPSKKIKGGSFYSHIIFKEI